VYRRSRSRPRLLAAGLVLVLVAASLSACTEVEEKETAGYEPSSLEDIEGGELKRVTFTSEGARRVGLRREPIRRRGKVELVPYEALVYDPHGKTYVYVATGPLSFHREEVKVDRIDGDRVAVSDGPPPGTEVVTAGAAEVYGTELEIAG
jgi:hypothetical protein